MKKIDVLGLAMIAVIFTLCLASPVVAENYPSRAITIIVPFGPGGNSDNLARAVAVFAEDYLGQPVVIVNKEGAGSLIGLRIAAKADPNGYTLALISSASTSAIEWEIANRREPSVTRQDFIPIASLSKNTAVVIVPYDSPWKTLNDLITDCKAKPNHYRFSSAGAYSASHVPVELVMKITGITARHVPYKGGGEAVRAVVGRHVDFSIQYPSTTFSLYRGKKIRILAAMDKERIGDIPEVPTTDELGFSDAVFFSWNGLAVPKKTPTPIVEKLSEVIEKISNNPKFVEALRNGALYKDYRKGKGVEKDWNIEAKMYAELFKYLIAKEGTK